ncbi:HXXEE domain-containing protein [Candidatus Kaiserbacteria bacterium]|nr:HXXEE domain-containing protein [Candidatus Kaiserbacteria bacterium]
MTKIILISIPMFLLHAWEEYAYQFYLFDPLFGWLGAVFGISALSIFLIEQAIVLVLLLITAYKLYRSTLIVVGLIIIFEISHISISLINFSYVPGLITSLPLLALGTIYWWRFLTLARK